MEWYYVWWPWLAYNRVAQVCQHQLNFLYMDLVVWFKWKWMNLFVFIFCALYGCPPLMRKLYVLLRSPFSASRLCSWPPSRIRDLPEFLEAGSRAPANASLRLSSASLHPQPWNTNNMNTKTSLSSYRDWWRTKMIVWKRMQIKGWRCWI